MRPLDDDSALTRASQRRPEEAQATKSGTGGMDEAHRQKMVFDVFLADGFSFFGQLL